MVCKHFVAHIFKRAGTHFFCTQLNGFKYCYIIRIILSAIIYLFGRAFSWCDG